MTATIKFYGNKDIRSAYISTRQASKLARFLKELGYKITAKECNEYAVNVVKRLAGANQDEAQQVYAEIHAVLDIEDFLNYRSEADEANALPGYVS